MATGLESLRRSYGSAGYIDAILVPTTNLLGDSAVELVVSVEEGKQYYMGKIEILGAREITHQLQPRWELGEGTAYDQAYLEKFLGGNHNILPDNFSQSGNVEVVRDCRDATISIRIVLQKDGTPLAPLHDANCQAPPKAPAE